MNYKMFKITSGEFIVACIKSETETHINCDTPFIVHFGATDNGQLAINLFPLNPFATKVSEEYEISKSHILITIEDIHPEIVKQYTQITSGIVLATEKDVPKLSIT